MLPEEVPGHISQAEGQWLSEAASGLVVLEIGSYRGRSTAYLASSALLVLCCEPFIGQKTLRKDQCPVDFSMVRADWHLHIAACGFQLRVELLECRSTELRARLSRRASTALGMIFVDGSHELEDVEHDLGLSALLSAAGILAVHDARSSRYPSVEHGVSEWYRQTADFTEIPSFGTIRAFQRHSI